MKKVETLWSEAAEWCAGGDWALRERSIAPSDALVDRPLDFARTRGHDAIASEIDRVVAQRRAQLASAGASTEGSQIVLSMIALTAIGRARSASEGWFDDHELPPWGAWMAYIHVAGVWVLVSHVPIARLAHVERAVVGSANLRWATLDDLTAIDALLPEGIPIDRRPFR